MSCLYQSGAKKAPKKQFLSNYAKHLCICNWIKRANSSLRVMNRNETKLVDITEAVVLVELIEAMVQAIDLEINEGLRCSIEKKRIDSVSSTRNLSENSPILIV